MVEHVARFVLPAALSLLPKRMDTLPARAMLIAIGLQESRFLHRVQIGGPARGFWQFEKGGGVKGVLTHSMTQPLLLKPLQTLGYSIATTECYDAIADNDTLACIFARLLLWTVPGRLPSRHMPGLAWSQYLDGWRPGKPHPATWDAFFEEGWQRVTAEAAVET
jgi:hypothetical protein